RHRAPGQRGVRDLHERGLPQASPPVLLLVAGERRDGRLEPLRPQEPDRRGDLPLRRAEQQEIHGGPHHARQRPGDEWKLPPGARRPGTSGSAGLRLVALAIPWQRAQDAPMQRPSIPPITIALALTLWAFRADADEQFRWRGAPPPKSTISLITEAGPRIGTD